MKRQTKDVLTLIIFGAAVFAVLAVAVKFKAWQCEEMFPNANLTACIFWSGK